MSHLLTAGTKSLTLKSYFLILLIREHFNFTVNRFAFYWTHWHTAQFGGFILFKRQYSKRVYFVCLFPQWHLKLSSVICSYCSSEKIFWQVTVENPRLITSVWEEFHLATSVLDSVIVNARSLAYLGRTEPSLIKLVTPMSVYNCESRLWPFCSKK